MELNKQQSFEVYLHNYKIEANKVKYTYVTKTKWWCLHCLTELYVSYKQYGVNSIFCVPCYMKTAKMQTVAQYQYMMKLKNSQLATIEDEIYYDREEEEKQSKNNSNNSNN